jgi:phosphoesterase RecJ-like protein
VFDTQLFRFIRASSRSYLIAADLLKYKLSPETVHQNLFANHTVDKMIFLSKALADISYFCNGRLAVMHINKEDLLKHSLEMDDSRDVVDLIMNISTLEAAVLIREDGPSKYKISIRSKGNIPVLEVAESLGGGGHVYSSGAYLQDNVESIKKKLTEKLTRLIEQL